MKRTNRISLLLVSVVLSFSMMSCFDAVDEYEPFDVYAQYVKDSVIIDNYIVDNDIDAYEVDGYGMFVSVYHEGSDDPSLHPTRDTDTSSTIQYVTAGYKGALVDGTIFDMTGDSTAIEFALSNVVGGWQLGFPELSKGDSALLLIPSYLAYGNNAIGSIPANSVLVFDVFLQSFERR